MPPSQKKTSSFTKASLAWLPPRALESGECHIPCPQGACGLWGGCGQHPGLSFVTHVGGTAEKVSRGGDLH